jgi:hypothetical protein
LARARGVRYLRADRRRLRICRPVSAQTTEFYVVQDVKTKKCMIVDRKPTSTFAAN